MSRLDDLVEKYKLGEIEFDDLVNHAKPIMVKFGQKLGISFNEIVEDYFQEGSIILLDCLEKYKENTKCTFLTYFSNNIKWKFYRIHNANNLLKIPNLTNIKIEEYYKPKVIGSTYINSFGGIGDLFDEYLITDSFEDYLMVKLELEKIINTLEGSDRDLIELFLDGYTLTEASKVLNIKVSTLGMRYTKIKRKINEIFQGVI